MRHHGHLGASQGSGRERSGRERGLAVCVMRQGAGKIKHLSVRQLWLQERVSSKQLEIVKVAREVNPSDPLTHYWSAKDGLTHFSAIGLTIGG